MKAIPAFCALLLVSFAVMVGAMWGVTGILGVGVPALLALGIAYLCGQRSYELAIIGIGSAIPAVFVVGLCLG